MSKNKNVEPSSGASIDTGIEGLRSEASGKTQKLDRKAHKEVADRRRSRSQRTPAARAYHSPAKLNDGIVHLKRPNAQKHGVFASAPIIPGEDPREFQELLAEVIDEWDPTTPSQRDAVFDLADTKWRKRRLKKAVQTELYVNTFDPAHHAFNEVWGFHMFLHHLQTRPERCLDYAEKCLRRGNIYYLNRKFPRSNYQSTPEWVQAVRTEILSVLLPAVPGQRPEQELSDLEKAAHQWRTDQQVAASMAKSRELLEYEAKETERLDARIARQVKFLVELKTMQQILAGT